MADKRRAMRWWEYCTKTLRKSWPYVTIVVVSCGAAAPFLWTNKASEVAYSGPVDTISTGVVGEYASLVWIAQAKGYFASNGLNVAIKPYTSGPVALSALLNGQIDTAVGSDFAGATASFLAPNLKILANISTSQAFYLVGRRDHGLSSIASLAGKKIGFTNATVGQLYLSQFLALNNLAGNDIATLNMPQAGLVDALAKGTVDAAVLFQPNAYNAQNALGKQAVSWPIQGGQSIYSVLFGTSKLVDERPQVLDRYMKALLQAQGFVSAHNDQARAIVAAQLHYSQAYISAVWPHFDFTLSLNQELLLNMENEAQWVIQSHTLPATKAPNYLQMMYFNAIESADPGAVTVIH